MLKFLHYVVVVALLIAAAACAYLGSVNRNWNTWSVYTCFIYAAVLAGLAVIHHIVNRPRKSDPR